MPQQLESMVRTRSSGTIDSARAVSSEYSECLLVAMAVEEGLRFGQRGEQWSEARGRGGLHQELLQQPGAGGRARGLRSGDQDAELVAQGEQAGGFEPDHRHPALEKGRERFEQAPRFVLRLLHQPGGEEGASAAQWTAHAVGRGDDLDRTAAGGGEHPHRGARHLRFQPAREGVDEQGDGRCRTPPAAVFGAGAEEVAARTCGRSRRALRPSAPLAPRAAAKDCGCAPGRARRSGRTTARGAAGRRTGARAPPRRGAGR